MNDWLVKRAELSPDKLAIIDKINSNKLTYEGWNYKVNKLANFLLNEFNVRKGDIVSILSTNKREYLDLFFACGKIGAILQSLNFRLTKFELFPLLREAGPKALFYGKSYKDKALQIKEACKIPYIVELSEDKWEKYSGEFAYTAHMEWDDPWAICYTGGTTGIPKGVILTYRNITFNAVNTVTGWGLSNKDAAPIITPLFHTSGLNVFTTPLVYIGGANLIMKKFDSEAVLNSIGNHEITVLFGVPTMFIELQESPFWEKTDFSHLKLAINGGAPCPEPVFTKWWEKDVIFKTGYGLTEAGPNNFWLPDRDVKRKINSVGFPLFNVNIKIVNERGEEAKKNEEGEILISGPHVTPGYFKRDTETKNTIVDGWLHTGDIGFRDNEGYYFISGRKKDVIISGGENIYPAVIESVLMGHVGVKEVAVIGIPDKKWGEAVEAIIVTKSGVSISEEELKRFLKERIASYEVPKKFVFVKEIPKTPVGKIDKKLLKQKYGK